MLRQFLLGKVSHSLVNCVPMNNSVKSLIRIASALRKQPPQRQRDSSWSRSRPRLSPLVAHHNNSLAMHTILLWAGLLVTKTLFDRTIPVAWLSFACLSTIFCTDAGSESLKKPGTKARCHFPSTSITITTW